MDMSKNDRNEQFLKKNGEIINSTTTPPARFGHTANLISKTTVVIFGGAISGPGNFIMTADLYLYNMATNVWKKLEPFNNLMPQARAAHASATVRENQLLVYGGSIGNGQFATDELWFLDIKNNEEASWMKVPIEGQTPLWRYGHTIIYIMPILILFGGSGRNEIVNDVWMLSTDRSPFKWEKININGNYPNPKVYHTANLFKVANQPEMMVIFGGRGQDNASHTDLVGLRKNTVRQNEWEWVDLSKSKSTTEVNPIGRHQHCSAFFGPFLFVVGGRVGSKESSTFDVYSTIRQKWYRFGIVSLFRHSIWVYYNVTSQDNYEIYLYIYGGFDGDNNSQINANLYKINVVSLFSQDETLRCDLNEHVNLLLAFRKNINVNGKTQKNNEEKTFVLSSKVVVHTVGEDFGEIVKKHSLQKLKEVNKKAIPGNTMESTKKYVYDETLVKDFIENLLPLPENFEPKLKNDPFYFDKDKVLSIVQQATEIFENTPSLLKLKSPIKIFGNIDGQYNDLVRYFNYWGRPSEHKGDIESFEYLFLGNFVGRGAFSLDTLCLLLALKVKYPDQFHILRGSHDDIELAKFYGLYDECRNKLGEDPDKHDSVFKHICLLFEYLPVAATVNNKIFCVHSGIGPNIKTLDDIANLKKPIRVYGSSESDDNQVVLDLLWSSPTGNALKEDYNVINRTSNLRKRQFNEDAIIEFNKNNGLDLMVRSHDIVEKGFEKLFNNRVVTICSSTNYCTQHNNDGGIIFVKKSLEVQPKILPNDEHSSFWIDPDNKTFPITPKKTFKNI